MSVQYVVDENGKHTTERKRSWNSGTTTSSVSAAPMEDVRRPRSLFGRRARRCRPQAQRAIHPFVRHIRRCATVGEPRLIRRRPM